MGQPIHLPNVPDDDVRDFSEEFHRRGHVEARFERFLERLEEIDPGDQEVIALKFVAVTGFDGAACPTKPVAAAVRVFVDEAEFPVEDADALGNWDMFPS